MRLIDARKLVPGASKCIGLPQTGLASKQIEAALEQICPAIEQMSIDAVVPRSPDNDERYPGTS